jgi:GDP-L-fucose synthase
MEKNSRIFVAGHRGLVGSAIKRKLEADGYTNLIVRTRAELNLTDPMAVDRFFRDEAPEYVFLAAALVGGIVANMTYPGDFIRENLLLQTHVIDAAHKHKVKKLQFLGSSCVYPKFAPQPIPEEALLSSSLEPTNEPYAVAKIAGLTMVQAYRRQYGFRGISLMPTNLYGPADNFDPVTSHVVPAMIRKFHEAKRDSSPEVTLWGTGSPRRELLHVDDFADAAVFLMLHYDDDSIINVGTGEDVTIQELAELIREVTEYKGRIVFDSSKPDGTPRKQLDVTRLQTLGWHPQIPLRQGLLDTYKWFVAAGQ